MAKLFFLLNVSVDGYVDHDRMGAPGPALFQHYIEHVGGLTGIVYGRRSYELMSYWDQDQADWDAPRHAFAAAWRSRSKWVVSRTLKSVGPNASLIQGDIEGALRDLKAGHAGEISIQGPDLVHSLRETDLVDEYRLYTRPYVLGHGKPYFMGPRPPLRLTASDRIGEDALRLIYVPG